MLLRPSGRRQQGDVSNYPPGGANVDRNAGIDKTDQQPSDTKVHVVELQTEFDDYGTELHRDARVWKVYVKEADTHDAELVKGWNDSTDVLLVFAALFSAISTAFLIETSKMLQPDPADVSAKTLQVISRTLLDLVNGTQPPVLVGPPADGLTKFIPSRTAVYVNTLWYLSLSLSLATSFIAILSKDWCRSFMSNRTGHAYLQTRRRQRKWDMIEQWKMSELLAMLPSMVHLALLLFSIGLCILLWDTHSVVAIPVICVTGFSFGFYICSSIAAAILDYFPYSTVISGVCRTKPAQLVFSFIYQFMVQPISRCLCKITSYSKYILMPPFTHLSSRLVPIFQQLTNIKLAYVSLRFPLHMLEIQVRSQLTKLQQTLDQAREGSDNYDSSPELTSLALSWILKTCEEPQSIDVALQSIAGARGDFVRGPVMECDPISKIKMRLASGNIYRGNNAEALVSLYARALSFLSSSVTTEEELDAPIWNMQKQIESTVASMITDSRFQPSQGNLDVLRIATTAASRSFQLLQGRDQNAQGIFKPIAHLLERHLDKTAPLHSVSLSPLANSSTLLLLFAPSDSLSPTLLDCCIRLATSKADELTPKLRVTFMICALFHQNCPVSNKASRSHTAYVKQVIGTLEWIQSQGDQTLEEMIEFGFTKLQGSLQEHCIGGSDQILGASFSDKPIAHFIDEISYLVVGERHKTTSARYIQAFHGLHRFTLHDRAGKDSFLVLYRHVLESIYRHPPKREDCWLILSGVPFPDPQRLDNSLDQYCTLANTWLPQATPSDSPPVAMQFFTWSILWLCFTRYLAWPNDIRPKKGLHNSLEKYQPDGIKEHAARYNHLNKQLSTMWDKHWVEVVAHLGAYSYRIIECVLETRETSISEPIEEALVPVSKDLRGLSQLIWLTASGKKRLFKDLKAAETLDKLVNSARVTDRSARAVEEGGPIVKNETTAGARSQPADDDGKPVTQQLNQGGGKTGRSNGMVEHEMQPSSQVARVDTEGEGNEDSSNIRATENPQQDLAGRSRNSLNKGSLQRIQGRGGIEQPGIPAINRAQSAVVENQPLASEDHISIEIPPEDRL